MPKKREISALWPEFTRYILVTVSGLIAWQYQQLNITLRDLTSVARGLELRITAIEADRSAKGKQYEQLLSDAQNMKVDLSQVKERVNIIAEFVAKMASPKGNR